MVPQLTLIIKLNNHCNLSCKYCYDGQFRKKKQGKIDKKLLIKLIDDSFVVSSGYIHYIWHGSEPLLYDNQAFIEILDYIEALKNKHLYKIEHSIQTNGTLIDLKWIRIFKKYNFIVGVSYDGIPEINDKNRVFNDGSPTSKIVLAKIALLQKHNINVGTLSVITKDSYNKAKEVFKGLQKTGIKWHDFIPNFAKNPYGDGDLPGHIDDKEYLKFMIELFDEWVANNNSEIFIRHLGNILDSLLGGHPTICKLAGTCSDWFFTVTSDGDIYPCDSFAGNSKWFLGNISIENLDFIINNMMYQSFRNRHKELKDKCNSCNWYFCCNAGCTNERYIINDSLSDLYTCQANKELFNHIFNYVNNIKS